MRIIGHLENEARAKTLGDYLTSVDIRNQVEQDDQGWAVWIHSEDQMDAGKQALTAYLQNPNDAKYQEASRTASLLAAQEKQDKVKFQKRFRNRDQIWRSSSSARVTLVFIVISVIITLASNLPSFPIHWFFMSDLIGAGLLEVQHGQVWRLLTPIFIHFGMLHLFFDMYWLYILGSMIEIRGGSIVLLRLLLVIGIGSNLGQFYFYNSPLFGGMSGVDYGLFGYIWLRSMVDPNSGLYLDPMTIWVMIIWFFLCWFGMIGNVANGAHAVGLLIGILWGAAPKVRRIS
jgi:GlpG protein